MKPTLVATLCAILCAGPTAAVAQDEDDWEFEHAESRRQTVAAVRYDAGVAIVVQCREGALSAALIGMPAVAETFELQATRADGRVDTQTWVPAGTPGVFLSTVPARDIRFMRGGGAYSVRTGEGAARALRTTFDLPTQSANLDRVLTACGWALTDDRDLLTRTGNTISLVDPDAQRRRPPQPSRSVAQRRRPPPPPPPGAPSGPPTAELQVSCIVRSLRLTDCRPDHAPAPGAPDRADLMRRLEGSRVYAPDAAAEEGKVFYPGAGQPLIVVTREQLL